MKVSRSKNLKSCVNIAVVNKALTDATKTSHCSENPLTKEWPRIDISILFFATHYTIFGHFF